MPLANLNLNVLWISSLWLEFWTCLWLLPKKRSYTLSRLYHCRCGRDYSPPDDVTRQLMDILNHSTPRHRYMRSKNNPHLIQNFVKFTTWKIREIFWGKIHNILHFISWQKWRLITDSLMHVRSTRHNSSDSEDNTSVKGEFTKNILLL